MSRNTNEPALQGASSFLNQFKQETANELGISNYNEIDKGQLTSRENGYVGGTMVRKMIQYAEQNMGSGNANMSNQNQNQSMSSSNPYLSNANPQDLSNASMPQSGPNQYSEQDIANASMNSANQAPQQ